MKTFILLVTLAMLCIVSCKKEARSIAPIRATTIITNSAKDTEHWIQDKPLCYDDLNTLFIRSSKALNKEGC